MAERGLHQMDWGAAIEGVAGVGVTQPVRTDVARDPGPAGSRPDDPPRLQGCRQDG